MTWIVTAFSILGVVLNIYKNKWCFAIWAVTNFSWMIIDFREEIYSQSLLFAVYFILAVFGLYKWSKQNDKTKSDETGKTGKT